MEGLRIEATGKAITVTIERAFPVPMRGAAILAVLAAPPRCSDDAVTLLAYRHWCRLLVDLAGEEEPGWLMQPQPVVPNHVLSPLAKAQRALPRLLQSVDKRLAAAHTIRNFLQTVEDGAPSSDHAAWLHGEVTLTLADDAASSERLNQAGLRGSGPLPSSSGNFEGRVVRASLPVAHIAFALAQGIKGVEHHLAKQPTDVIERHAVRLPGLPDRIVYQGVLGDLLLKGDIQEVLLARAEALEPLLEALRRPTPSRVIRIRWADAATLVQPPVPYVAPADVEASTITLPADATDTQLAVTLLSILAAPPLHASDRAWLERCDAFYRLLWDGALRASIGAGDKLQLAVPAHLTMGFQRAGSLTARSMKDIDERRRAGEALLPSLQSLFKGEGVRSGADGKPWSLAGAIETALTRQRRRQQAGLPIGHSASPPAVTARHVENFRQRLLAPARNVIHLAVGFVFALEMLAREVGEVRGTHVEASTPGAARDHFDWRFFCQAHPRFARIAVNLAADLEYAACSLPAGGPQENEIVRLRIRTA